MMIHRMALPEAFGTATFSGLFYETFMKDVTKEKYVEVGRAVLSIPFVFSIGFRKVKDLAFIAEEAKGFVKMAEDDFGITPDITFV